jgi:hypothetical protein
LNIALPTLLVIAAIIPGIAFLNSYYAGMFPRQLAGLSPLTELALYVLWALPIDAIALHVARVPLDRASFDLTASIFGVASAPPILDPAFEFVRSGGLWVWSAYYVLVILLAVLAGSLLRRTVWALRLDTRLPILRLRAEWYYVLMGRSSGLPWSIIPQADVLATHPDEGSRMYVGVVSGFEPAKDGGIEQLYLFAAQRYRRDKVTGTHELKEIPGDRLAIKGSAILSINMRYFVVSGPPVVPGPLGVMNRLTWAAGNLVREFSGA